MSVPYNERNIFFGLLVLNGLVGLHRRQEMGTVRGFILRDCKIIADGDYSHGIKRCLFLRRKAMTNLYSILKSRDIALPTKVHLVKAMVFPVVICGYESWTENKAECQKIDAFELWC